MPAPIVNGGGHRVGKVLQKPRDLDLDLGSGHTAYRRAHSSTSTYTPNFIEIDERFVDGRTDVQTYLLTDIFTARSSARIASAVLAVTIPSVRLSVRLSHAGIVSKRLHVARCTDSKMCLVL